MNTAPFNFSFGRAKLLSSSKTGLTECLHGLLDLERCLTGTCTCSFVTILCLSSSVLCECAIEGSNLIE